MTENLIQDMQMLKEANVIEALQKLNLIDDFLFDVTTEDIEACKIIIELTLGTKIKDIRWREGQRVIHNLPGRRGIRMDFYVEDMDGNIFDVEMQRRNEGNIPKRTRFYQAMVDAPLLKSGERSFDNLRPTYIIVICGFDLFGYGRYCYTFKNLCQEIPELELGDECTKLILNTKGINDADTPRSLIEFLRYVENSVDENVSEDCDERLKCLHEKIRKIKANAEIGVAYMKMEERDRLIKESGVQLGIQEGIQQGIQQGMQQGIQQGIQQGVRILIDTLQERGDSKEEICSTIMEKYLLDREKAEEYLKLFYK